MAFPWAASSTISTKARSRRRSRHAVRCNGGGSSPVYGGLRAACCRPKARALARRRGGPLGPVSSASGHAACEPCSNDRPRLVMFDERKRIVEMVQERAPCLVALRLAKTYNVIGDAVPLHQEQIAPRRLDAG